MAIDMKELIRKILRENLNSPLEGSSAKERIEELEKRKKKIEKLLPSIVKFYEMKYGDDLFKIEISEKGLVYGNENHKTKIPQIKLYLKEFNEFNKSEIFNDLNSFFNIDTRYYGVPLDIEIYVMKWKQI